MTIQSHTIVRISLNNPIIKPYRSVRWSLLAHIFLFPSQLGVQLVPRRENSSQSISAISQRAIFGRTRQKCEPKSSWERDSRAPSGSSTEKFPCHPSVRPASKNNPSRINYSAALAGLRTAAGLGSLAIAKPAGRPENEVRSFWCIGKCQGNSVPDRLPPSHGLLVPHVFSGASLSGDRQVTYGAIACSVYFPSEAAVCCPSSFESLPFELSSPEHVESTSACSPWGSVCRIAVINFFDRFEPGRGESPPSESFLDDIQIVK